MFFDPNLYVRRLVFLQLRPPCVSQNYNVSPTPNAADARAIASDFIVTGNDMRSALAEYGRTR